MIHRQDIGDTHTHKHQRFGSGVYFKIRPIQLVQKIENLHKLQVYFDLVFNSMHCNIQFLPIPLGFTILKCVHRCPGTESPLTAVPPNMLVLDPGVVIIIMGLHNCLNCILFFFLNACYLFSCCSGAFYLEVSVTHVVISLIPWRKSISI